MNDDTDSAPIDAGDPEGPGVSIIRLLVAGDHALMREELREEVKRVLAQVADVIVTSEVSNGKEVLQQLKGKDTFDLLLLDMDMADGGGIDLITSVKTRYPALPIIISIRLDQTQVAILALIAGASGFIVKNSGPEILLSAIHAIANGDIYIDPALIEQTKTLPQNQRLHDLLSIHEFAVFLHLGAGKSIAEIAKELSISMEMVKDLKASIMKKMNLQNIEDLMHYAIRHGFANDGPP